MFSSHGRQNSEMELILQIGGITRLNMPPTGSAPVPQTGHAAALAGGDWTEAGSAERIALTRSAELGKNTVGGLEKKVLRLYIAK